MNWSCFESGFGDLAQKLAFAGWTASFSKPHSYGLPMGFRGGCRGGAEPRVLRSDAPTGPRSHQFSYPLKTAKRRKSLVAESLLRSRHEQSIGLVDQDPGAASPPYLKEFKVHDEVSRLRLVRYQHPKDQKWLVEIQPDLEPWLYDAAKGLPG